MSSAVIPMLWRWEGVKAEAFDDAHNAADGHNETLDHSPPRGVCSANRYWLSERRDRWFHEAQVRG